jgi:hypothetical protein
VEAKLSINVKYKSRKGEYQVIESVRIGQDEIVLAGMTLPQLQSYMRQVGWNLKGAHISFHGKEGWVSYDYVRAS